MRLFLGGKDGPCELVHVDTRVGRVGEGPHDFAPITALALKTARKDSDREADDLSLESALISRAHCKGKGPATWATTFRQDYVEIPYHCGCSSYETASDGPCPLLSPNL